MLHDQSGIFKRPDAKNFRGALFVFIPNMQRILQAWGVKYTQHKGRSHITTENCYTHVSAATSRRRGAIKLTYCGNTSANPKQHENDTHGELATELLHNHSRTRIND
jgi:hypothetical protein